MGSEGVWYRDGVWGERVLTWECLWVYWLCFRVKLWRCLDHDDFVCIARVCMRMRWIAEAADNAGHMN